MLCLVLVAVIVVMCVRTRRSKPSPPMTVSNQQKMDLTRAGTTPSTERDERINLEFTGHDYNEIVETVRLFLRTSRKCLASCGSHVHTYILCCSCMCTLYLFSLCMQTPNRYQHLSHEKHDPGTIPEVAGGYDLLEPDEPVSNTKHIDEGYEVDSGHYDFAASYFEPASREEDLLEQLGTKLAVATIPLEDLESVTIMH